MAKIKVAVSACLLGDKVRYDGKSKISPAVSDLLNDPTFEVFRICPEMLGGLPCPRDPAEIDRASNKVFTNKFKDVSEQYRLGAERALEYCQSHNIRVAVLKENSPSCGKHCVYDGTFSGLLIKCPGITAKLFKENGIELFDETEIEEFKERIKDRK